MSENIENKAQGEGQESFGIGDDVVGKNRVSLPGGFNKVYLTGVESKEVGKGATKYNVLNFRFTDPEGIKGFTLTEFVPKGKSNAKQTEKENYEENKARLYSRVKHIWDAYGHALPGGKTLGSDAKDWKSFFDSIATAFNTANNGKPVYQVEKDGTMHNVLVWLKNTYSKKAELQVPMFPNFIEKVTAETNQSGVPKSLVIDKRYDIIVQPDVNKAPTNAPGTPGVFGGTSNLTQNDSGDVIF